MRFCRRELTVAVSAALGSVLAAGVLVAVPSAYAASRSARSTLNIGVVAPFSGNTAEIGKLFDAACVSGAYAINQGGGVLGHKVACAQVDDTGDPADAVPNVSRAIATLKNFDLAVGLDTSTAATTVPLVNTAGIPLFTLNGLTEFDKTKDRYFWRLVPNDSEHGAGFALWAAKRHEKRIALVFENNPAATASVPGILSSVKALHEHVLVNETLAPNLSNYESAVEKVMRAKPQAIMMDGTAQTMITFFSEYSQLNKGSIPPIITSTDLVLPDFFQGIEKSLGKKFVPSHVTFIGFQVANQPNAYRAYVHALQASFPKAEVKSLIAQNLSILYDADIIGALAMDAAKSTKGSVYNKYIPSVTSAKNHAVKVHTYPQGLRALKAGKRIDYVGVEGQLQFNAYHNVESNFEIFSASATGKVKPKGIISAKTAAHLLG